MDILSAILEAQEIASDSAIDEEFRLVAFTKALELLLGPKSSAAVRSPNNATPTAQEGMPVDPLFQLSRELNTDAAALREIYSRTTDGTFQIVVGPSKLDSTKAGATKQLAMLVSGAQLALGNEWTTSEQIRSTCKDYGFFDPSNFASTVAELTDEFSFRGKGQSRELRLTRQGREALKNLISALMGGTD